jgi:hypothetical protein
MGIAVRRSRAEGRPRSAPYVLEPLVFEHPDVLVEAQVRSSPSYWLLRLVLGSVLGFVLTAIGSGILVQGAGLRPSRPIFWLAWILVSGVVIVLTWASERRLYFAVTTHSLQIGRSPRETVVEFDEIESIVVGLPPKQPWWIRFNPKALGPSQYLSTLRRSAILMRLRGGRYLALNPLISDLANVPELTGTLLRLSRGKVLGQDSYTPEEIQFLQVIRLNTIKML